MTPDYLRPTPDEFWQRVRRGGDNDCWPWTGAMSHNGYGQVYTVIVKDGTHKRTTSKAHRLALIFSGVEIPDGLVCDHVCRNRACCNPLHIELVTGPENVARGIAPTAINARRRECVNGHPFNEENTRIDRNGWRRCRACARQQRRNAPPTPRRPQVTELLPDGQVRKWVESAIRARERRQRSA